MDPGTDHSTDHQAKIIHSIHHKILDQITEAAITQVTMTGTIDRTTTKTMAETEVTSNNRGMNREIRTIQTRMTITKIETGSTTEEDQTNTNTTGTNTKLKSSLNSQTKNIMEMMQMVRGFINLIKANPTTREQYKSNKLATRKYNNKVNELEIQSSSLEQVQQFFNEDSDVIFDALVAADYINEIDCTDGTHQQQA